MTDAGQTLQMLYNSHQIKAALVKLESIVHGNGRVNIYGESGTGKELLARYIHEKSSRSHGPFVAVNCRENMGELARSEFFGYISGAFTGASRKGKAGFYEQADGGFLFLDEVDGMPIPLQQMLLRTEYEVRKVGGQKTKKPDVRIVTASKSNLADLVRQGQMGFDFYFRIMGHDIWLPPLREREGDVAYLARHFCQLLSKGSLELHDSAYELMQEYRWPGNVRELVAVISLAVESHGTLGIPYIHANDIKGYMKFWDFKPAVQAAEIGLERDASSTLSLAERWRMKDDVRGIQAKELIGNP